MTSSITHKIPTREGWLIEACDSILNTIIMPVVTDHKKPNIKVSVGFPYRSSKAIGQCFPIAASDGDFNEIFIHPETSDSLRVLDILTHELIHAVDNCESGHKNFFAKTARAVGLEGKFTSTVAGAELSERLNTIIAAQGEIPHSKMALNKGPVKKQGTRMLKLECGSCGFTARTSNKWIEQLPEEAHCPICNSAELGAK